MSNPTPPLRHDPNVAYFLVTATLTMGYGSVLTLLAEFREQFGFSATELGVMTAVGFFAGFVGQVALAPLADRGWTPQMIKGGVALAAVGMLGMVFATQLWGFVLSRLIFGLSSGAVAPAMRRLIITRDPENLGANLGRLASFDILGFVIGPTVSAVFVEIGGLRLPFIVLGLANVVMIGWVSRLDLDTPAGDGQKRRTLPLLRLPALQSALLAGVAFYLTIAYFETTWALLMDDLGAETWMIGVSLSVFTLPMVFLAPRGGRIAQQRGHAAVVGWSIAGAMLCTLAYGWLPSLWMVLGVSVLHAVADAFTLPANQVGVAKASPPEQIAAAQGLFSATGTLVSGFVALAAGYLYESSGRETLYSVAAAAMAVFLAASLVRHRAATRQAAAPANETAERGAA